jgi:hypothetical protein
MSTDQPTTASADELATQWLAAEARAELEPASQALAAQAAELGEAYDAAIRGATREELRLAWEAARVRQAQEEVGSRSWDDARRVSELLRTEYDVARSAGG